MLTENPLKYTREHGIIDFNNLYFRRGQDP